MKTKQSEPNPAKRAKVWQPTQFENLIRYISSGIYFARLRVNGNLIRKSLKTDVLSVAKLRSADLEKSERESAETQKSASKGHMTVADCIAIYESQQLVEAHLMALSAGSHREHYQIMAGDRITHHDLRHLFATRCIESGVDIPTVSRWLGHKDGGAPSPKSPTADQRELPTLPRVGYPRKPGPHIYHQKKL